MEEKALNNLIAAATAEDVATQDMTTKILVDEDLLGSGKIISKAEGVVSGQDCAGRVFSHIDPEVEYTEVLKDGEAVVNGGLIAEVRGNISSILTAERIALNFLGHLSGIATITSIFVQRLKESAIEVLDTRKTTPGLRTLEKKAVRDGGGRNHRIDLSELILVKENHINAAGGLEEAVARLGKDNLKRAEIEVDSFDGLLFLLEDPPMRIMLDNFTPEMVLDAVKEIGKIAGMKPKIEVSGGVTLRNVEKFAIPGIDYISIGSITSSAPALDVSMITAVKGD